MSTHVRSSMSSFVKGTDVTSAMASKREQRGSIDSLPELSTAEINGKHISATDKHVQNKYFQSQPKFVLFYSLVVKLAHVSH